MPDAHLPLIDWPRTLFSALVVGILYYMLASPAASIEQSTTLAPIAWPAPTFVIALLWRKPWREWAPYLLAVFIAMMFVGDLDWLPVQTDAGFALLNVIEIAACVLIGRRWVARDGQIDTLRKLTRFLLLLPLAVTALVAAAGATLASSALQGDWLSEWRILLVGNGLAILVLVPALLAWSQPPRQLDAIGGPARTGARVSLAGVAVVVCSLLACIVFDWSEASLRVLLSLALVGTALYGGMRSAALTMSVSAVLAVLMTLYELGPYRQDGLDSTWRLQVDLAGLAVLGFFVAVAVRERQALSARMEQMRRFESLGLMAGGIAHDFNNVLGAAGGYAELAQDRIDPASPAAAPLQQVMSAVARGRELTEQILLAARRGDRQRSMLDLRDAVDEAVRLARPLCAPGIVIDFVPPPQALVLQANPGQLMRVALNLVRNASQAARSRVVVSLHAGSAPGDALLVGELPSEQALWLDVADDGGGIAPEHMSRLFDPFFSTRSGPGGKGTGLGLAIVAGIATEHDGGVAVSSSEAGTLFRLLLPAAPAGSVAPVVATTDIAEPAQEPAPGFAPEPPVPQEQPGQGECVFVVDDDRAQRELCEEWLSAMGFEPIGFADPQEALQEFALEPLAVDLLISDLDMPQMQGDALLAQVRALRPGMPALLCSARPQLMQLAATLQVPALAKPFDRAALRRAIIATLAAGESRSAQAPQPR
jgi:signal transduction histidine kinase/CheY-like chemotaxis protein